MNKIYFWPVVGGMLLIFIAAISGYVFVEKNSIVADSDKVDESDIVPTIIPTRAAPQVQSIEPVLVKVITINAKGAKSLAESNDQTGTYLGSSVLLPSGNMAYLVEHGFNTSLFLNEAKVADDVLIFSEMAGKLMYISNDFKSSTHSLFYGQDMLATAPVTSLTDIFDVKEIDGKLAYTVVDKDLKQKTLFYDGKKVAVAQNIQNIQKTSGGISYVAHDYSSDSDTLFYNGKAVASAHEIPDYVEDANGRLAYTTFTFTGKTPPKDSGYMGGEYPTIMTLFEDGKKVVSAGGIELKKISGKLAYITKNEKSQLYYDGKVIQSADYIDKLTEVAGKPTYTATDYGTEELRLFLGDRLITKTQMAGSIQFRDVGGKLVYSVYDSSAQENVTFYDEQKLLNVQFYSLQEVNGKLAYITYDQSQKGSLVYDNQKVGGDYNIKSAIAFKSDPGVLYFTTSKETESSTLISIYKINLQ